MGGDGHQQLRLGRVDNVDHAVLQLQAVLDEPAYGAGIDLVLAVEQALGQAFGRVGRQHVKCRLDHDRTMVEFRGNEVHGGAMQLDAGVQRLLVGVQPGEARQQRRVDIQQPARIAVDKTRRQDAHEAGQHHQVGRMGIDGLGHRGVKRGAVGELAMVDHAGGNALLLRELQPGGIGPVRQHRCHAGRPATARAGPDDGFHVGATPGNQDDNFFHRAILPRRGTKLR
ncbi:hypothetical protein D3C81_1480630 [compost metagenome]